MHRFPPRPAILACWALALGLTAAAIPPKPLTRATATRVRALLARMSLVQQIRLLHGAPENPAQSQAQAGYLPGDPVLGIPGLRFADGPPGVLTRHRATALTATMGLAATFSRRDAYRNGLVIGRDARALGIQVALQPFINIFRDPAWARAYNTYGEDPLLTGIIGAGVIRGIQSQGVMAQAKHFIAYDGGMNVIVGAQALHQIYAEPFAYAIRAGVSSIMCSYNQVNGAFACGNTGTLTGLLRRDLRFTGFVTSDWGATHASGYINAGLDLEMPGSMLPVLPCYFCAHPPVPPAQKLDLAAMFGGHIPEEPAPPALAFAQSAPSAGLLAAVRAGQVSPARIAAAVGRILGQMDRFGLLDTRTPDAIHPVPFAADRGIVERTAEDGAVLLKNQHQALPLTSADLRSLALIGPGAGQAITIGEPGEKAMGFPGRDLSPLAALEQSTRGLSGRHITFAVADDMTGQAIPAARLSHGHQGGLLRLGLHGQAAGVDAQLNFTRRDHQALPAGTSAAWRGRLRIRRPGVYWLYLQLLGCRGQLTVDGHMAARTSGFPLHGDVLQPGQDNVLPTTDGLDNVRTALRLTAGSHAVAVRVWPDGSGRPVQVRLAWMTPRQRQVDFAAAVNAARGARTAVVFAWGRGRPAYALPGDQDRLIAAIARVNPNTIVVLNSSQPAALPWLPQVRGLLEMWYPGDGGGVATARLLLGRVDPSGHLPFTWARDLRQYVSHDPAHPERSSAGVSGVTRYSEGIFVGYRWFEQQHISPLFPFGFGLSYTRFRYSGLRVSPAPNGGLTVALTVENTGAVAGTAVPQVYLGPPSPAPAGAQYALRVLAGFARLRLAPGQRGNLVLHVPRRQLAYWSSRDHAWRRVEGRRTVYVGSSSRELPLHQAIYVR
ncbi:MAG: beta-glucosidase family protein [Terriglobales bacterium]